MAVSQMESAPEVEPGAEASRASVWTRRIAKIALFSLLGLVALVGIILVGINTDPGRNFIVQQIEAIEFENGMAVGIEEIDGSIYGNMTIRGLTISDPKGVFLSSPAVAVDWRPFAFISSHIDVRSLTAETMTLARLPEFLETPPNEDPLLPDYDIDIGELKIGQFIAEAPVSGERRVATLAGNVQISDGRAKANFNGATVAGQGRAGGDRIVLTLDAVPEDNKLDLKLDLNAPGDGVIAALAGLTEPLQVKLAGNGDWAKWNGKLTAALAGESLADMNLTGTDGTFNLQGSASIARFAPPATADVAWRCDQSRCDRLAR